MSVKSRLNRLEEARPKLTPLVVVNREVVVVNREEEPGVWHRQGRTYTEAELEALDGVTHEVTRVKVVYVDTPPMTAR